MSQKKIRKSTIADIYEIAKIHKKSYTSGHFTGRWSESLLRDYYRFFYVEGVEVLVTTQIDRNLEEQIIGFAVYGKNIPEIILQFKKKYILRIMQAGFLNPWLLLKKLVGQAVSVIFERNTHQPANFLLLSIAVKHKRGGIGGELLVDMLARIKASQIEKFGLYVSTDNIPAINAYYACSFEIKAIIGSQFYMETHTLNLK